MIICYRNSLCALIVLALFSLAGCAGVSSKAVEKHHYYLDVPRGEVSQQPASSSVLLIRPLDISPLYSGRELVYRMKDGRMESDFYNLFFVPPAEMISQNLSAWLGDAALGREVVGSSSLVQHDHILEGTVNALYADFSGSRPEAVAEVQFFLLDARKDDAVILSARYVKRAPLAGREAKNVVAGLQEALRAVFTSLEFHVRGKMAQKKVK